MIESFNVYQVQSEVDDNENLTEEQLVESGLSSGELRQSLLDRIKIELDNKKYSRVNSLVSHLGFKFSKSQWKSKKFREKEYTEFENKMYETPDEAFQETYWSFENELIYVLGVEG